VMRAAANDHTFVVNMRGRDGAMADWVIPRHVSRFVVLTARIDGHLQICKTRQAVGQTAYVTPVSQKVVPFVIFIVLNK
jgi:hypothetical protein